LASRRVVVLAERLAERIEQVRAAVDEDDPRLERRI